jgi:hypothetical protein
VARGVAIGIKVDPHGFTGVYGSVEKDTLAYGSATWICMHVAWAHYEGHDMVYMLLIRRTIYVHQY